MTIVKQQLCFIINVGGQKQGPYLNEHRSKFKHLEHSKGITIESVWLARGWKELDGPIQGHAPEKEQSLF